MRRIVTGIDGDGRSSVVSDGMPPVAFHASETSAAVKLAGAQVEMDVPAHEAVVHELWALDERPRRGISDPTASIAEASYDVDPAGTKWIVTRMGPHLQVPMHDTPTIDYAVIVAGDVEIGLETGRVRLVAGDTMVVDAVKHSWHAGPSGCTIATVQVGLRPEDRHS